MGGRPHVGRGQMHNPHIRELSARRNQAEHTHWDGQQGALPLASAWRVNLRWCCQSHQSATSAGVFLGVSGTGANGRPHQHHLNTILEKERGPR